MRKLSYLSRDRERDREKGERGEERNPRPRSSDFVKIEARKDRDRVGFLLHNSSSTKGE